MRRWNNRQHEEALRIRRNKNRERNERKNYEWISTDTSLYSFNDISTVGTGVSTEYNNPSKLTKVKKN